MIKALKIFKIAVIVIFTLVILGGGYYLLLYLDVLKTPQFIVDTPVIGQHISNNKETVRRSQYDKLISENEAIKNENEKLQLIIMEKKQEMEALQSDLTELEKTWKLTQADDDKLKEDVARLNEEIIDLKTVQSNQESAYKDMAGYFAQMKAKDAADIMSRLDDKDIIGILGQMENEMVAEILQNMEKDQAAAIAKKMLVVAP